MKKKYTKEQILKIMSQPTNKKRTISDEALYKMGLAYAAIYGDEDENKNDDEESNNH